MNCRGKERSKVIQNLVVVFIEKQKIGLLLPLFAVATCDGEVHPEEQSIIKSFMKAMEIDQFTNGTISDLKVAGVGT